MTFLRILIWIILIYMFYRWLCPCKIRNVLEVYFGVPGSGKTTLAAWFTKQANKQAWPIKWAFKHPQYKLSRWILSSRFWKRSRGVYSNVPITGAFKLDPQQDIGKVMICEGEVIIDEAGIEYNNRNFTYYRIIFN